MAWQTWRGTDSKQDKERLATMIFSLMDDVISQPAPPLNEWCDGGVDVGENADVIVYYEMQETEPDPNIMRPGYTLSLQVEDGQPYTATFFADNKDEWADIAQYFADAITSIKL